MKNGFLFLSSMISGLLFSQIGIGTLKPDESAILDVVSKTKGFLPPRMTENQRELIANPAKGLMLFCTDCKEGCFSINLGVTKSPDWYCLDTDSEIVLPENLVTLFCEEAVFNGEFVESIPFTGSVSIPIKSFFPKEVKITLESPETSFSSLEVEPFQPSENLDTDEKKNIQYTIKGKNDLVEGYYDIKFKQYGNQCLSKMYVSSSKAKLDLENVMIDPLIAKENGALPSFTKNPDVLLKMPYSEGVGVMKEKTETNIKHPSGIFSYTISNPRLDFTFNPSGNIEYSINMTFTLPHTVVKENGNIYFPIYFENNKVYEAPLYVLNNYTDDWKLSTSFETLNKSKNIENLKKGNYSFDINVYNRSTRLDAKFNVSIIDLETSIEYVKLSEILLSPKKRYKKSISFTMPHVSNNIKIKINQPTNSSVNYSTGLFLMKE